MSRRRAGPRTRQPAAPAYTATDVARRWVPRAMEGTWLLTVALVPAAFYYTTRAEMMDAFTTRGPEDEVEIARLQHQLALRAVDASPLSYSAKLAAATAAVRLAGLGDPAAGEDAVRLYEELLSMLPGFEPVYHDLAWAHLVIGRPGETLATLDTYIRVNGADPRPSADGLFLRGEAYRALGRTDDAVRALERYLETSPDGRYAGPARRSLDTLLAAAGDGG